MPPDDILLNKAAIIERCIRRIHEEYRLDPDFKSTTHTDALTLNIERACQAAIDMAMHLVAQQHLGVPQSSAEAFRLLEKAGLLRKELTRSLEGMTGFRNVAIHEYQELDGTVLHWIAEDGWKDWVLLCKVLGIHIDVGEQR